MFITFIDDYLISCKIHTYTVVAIIVRTPDTLDNIDNCCFQIMISTHKNIFSQISSHVHETCRWLLWARQISDEVSHLIVIFGISTFCSNYSSTSLWHSVIIFPENFNTNVILCQSIQRISLNVQYICPVYFPTRSIFAWWGWCLDFEGVSLSFSMSQQIFCLYLTRREPHWD